MPGNPTDESNFAVVRILTEEELENEAHRLLGKLFAVFGGLEMNLGLFNAGLNPAIPFVQEAERQDDFNFAEKLQHLLKAAHSRCEYDIDGFSRWAEWYMAADSVREVRNRLAHGRWGVIPHEQCVAHVSGLPGTSHQNERRYSLAQLEAEVQEAQRVNAEFSRLTKLEAL
jgi:hypothetical protein